MACRTGGSQSAFGSSKCVALVSVAAALTGCHVVSVAPGDKSAQEVVGMALPEPRLVVLVALREDGLGLGLDLEIDGV